MSYCTFYFSCFWYVFSIASMIETLVRPILCDNIPLDIYYTDLTIQCEINYCFLYILINYTNDFFIYIITRFVTSRRKQNNNNNNNKKKSKQKVAKKRERDVENRNRSHTHGHSVYVRLFGLFTVWWDGRRLVYKQTGVVLTEITSALDRTCFVWFWMNILAISETFFIIKSTKYSLYLFRFVEKGFGFCLFSRDRISVNQICVNARVFGCAKEQINQIEWKNVWKLIC